jgi:cytochrome c-type biogenesis protein
MLTQIYIHLGVALAGLVSFLSPCVLPLVPPYLGYLGGTTLEEMTSRDKLDPQLWQRVVLSSVCFVLGFTTVFVILGAGASVFGQWMQTYKAQLAVVAGIVIILFGVHFLGLLRIPLLYRDARLRANVERASFVGAYVMGLAFAFGWTPCIGPVLATVLTLAASEGSLGAGVRLLFVYSLGLGIPFVLAAVAIGPFLGFVQRFRHHLRRVEMAMGAVLVLTGVLMLTGSLNVMGVWLLENVPVLGRIEELVTPDRLQSEILKEGMGK